MAIDFKKFNEKLGKEYSFLYENRDNVAGYDEAVDAFDELISKNETFKKFVGDFAAWRKDFISSDREAAAFMFAAESFGLIG